VSQCQLRLQGGLPAASRRRRRSGQGFCALRMAVVFSFIVLVVIVILV